MSADNALDVHINVTIGRGAQAFRLTAQFNLAAGVLVLFGPSGCGKSLTLQAVVGTVRPRSGYIRLRGDTLFDAEGSWVPPHQRHIGYVPQHHSLFPFCSVRDNIAFGLPRERRRGADPLVARLIDELSLGQLADASPHGLSGGERQRVALARALAVEPKLLVLDEPFASLDVSARHELHATLRRTLERHNTPALFVTHDPHEALALGDELVRFERGRTVEQGACAELLPLAQTIELCDTVLEDLGPAGEGRRRYRIRDGILEAPAQAVGPERDGASSRLRMHLQAPSDPGDPAEE